MRQGQRKKAGGIVVVQKRRHDGPPRVGLVVSKRSGNAVTRNRIKRRLRHSVPAEQLEPGNDYVIIASKTVADAPQTDLEQWLRRAMGVGDHA